MTQLFNFLGFLVSIYMMLIFARIVLSWISWMGASPFADVLATITDPYLAWFSRFTSLRAGPLDLSPIVALGLLSLLNRVFFIIARFGTITVAIILALVLQAVWAAVSFFLGFLVVVLVLRLIAHLSRLRGASYFWRIIASVSQQVLVRLHRYVLRSRIINFTASLIISIAILTLVWAGLRLLVSRLSLLLAGLAF